MEKNERQQGFEEAMKEMGKFIWEHRTADDGDTIFAKFSKKDLELLVAPHITRIKE